MENNKCEALVIYDNYYSDLEEYVNCEFANKEEIQALPDDYKLVAYECEEKPLQVFSPSWIAERINEEKFSEERAEYEWDEVIKALEASIDFEKLNSMVPKLNYPTKHQQVLTKQDLLDAF